MRWIPVTEKMPPAIKDVLFVYRSSGVEKYAIGWWHDKLDVWYSDAFGEYQSEQATHWMFLPQPPSAIVDVETFIQPLVSAP